MSPSWYRLLLRKEEISVYPRTIKTIAENLKKRFELIDDQIRFIDREEDDESDLSPDDQKILNTDIQQLIEIVEAQTPEFQGRLKGIVERFSALSPATQEILLALMQNIVEEAEKRSDS